MPSAVLHIYLDLVLDGLVARIASGEDPKNLTAVLDLVEDSVRQQTPCGQLNSGATAQAVPLYALTRVRWLGPPRLRIVVPDSRSKLWIEP